MLSILKRFILKEWYKIFLASFTVLILLTSISTIVSGLLRSNVTAQEVFLNFVIELPSFIERILPISCLCASLFSIYRLKNRNELAAIFASGFNRVDFISTILIGSFFVAFFQFLNSSFLRPYIKSHRDKLISDSSSKFRNLKSKGLSSSTVGTGRLWFKSGDYFIAYSHYNPSLKKMFNVDMYYFKGDFITKKLKAKSIVYDQGYDWKALEAQLIDNISKPFFPTTQSYDEYKIKLLEKPQDLIRLKSDITILNIFKLYRYIQTLKISNLNVSEYNVLFYSNFSSALICIIFSLISAIGIFSPNRRGSSLGKNLILVFVFTVGYWLINSYLIELGKTSLLNPILACFGVPVLFLIILSLITYKKRKI